MLIGCCNFNENILSRELNLGMLRVNDGWQRTDDTVGVIDNRINRRIADNVEIFAKMLIVLHAPDKSCSASSSGYHATALPTYTVEFHQGIAIQFNSLVEGNKFDIFMGQCLISEWALDRIQVMGAHRSKCSLTEKSGRSMSYACS